MEQRDLLKDQIEQSGKILAKILSDFLGFKSKGLVSQGIEITAQRLQSELDIDIEELASLTNNEAKSYLRSRELTAEHAEVLSEYFKQVGVAGLETSAKGAVEHLELAIKLLDAADEISETLSLDRMNRKDKIVELLR